MQRSTAPGAKSLQSKQFVHRNHCQLTFQTAFPDTKEPPSSPQPQAMKASTVIPSISHQHQQSENKCQLLQSLLIPYKHHSSATRAVVPLEFRSKSSIPSRRGSWPEPGWPLPWGPRGQRLPSSARTNSGSCSPEDLQCKGLDTTGNGRSFPKIRLGHC